MPNTCPFSSIPDVVRYEYDDPEYVSDPDFDRRWLITEDSPEAGVIAITVEVDWINPLGNRITTRLGSLKADS